MSKSSDAQLKLRPAFAIERNPGAVAVAERTKLLADPGFGRVFTDHMAIIRYTEGKGWHDAKITARKPISLDPAAAVLHYAQEIFEGLKAYKLADGTMAMFRPEANARRFQASARRLAMAELPEELFVESIRQLVRVDRDWFPTVEGGSLYIRPFMFASEVFLGVKPSSEYLYLVILSPVGAYFKSGAPAVSIWVSQNFTRAAPGGTGAAKCGGNYASSLVAQAEASKHGCDQVVFLDAAEHKWFEELGGMNVFFVFNDGTLQTPPLSGTILPGITRDALITLAKTEGLKIREEPYSIDQCKADAKSGRLVESFACGTAAVVTPIGRLVDPSGEVKIGAGGPGQTTTRLKQKLVDIQRGTAPDPHKWVHRID
ncbi:MAG TPA: branched-chain amino acid aminotransferase [Hyphomicrobiaceae bacterium]|nr:branched-chain amino acid aminotransferase [Hyphomicrobiaceae bacterium]